MVLYHAEASRFDCFIIPGRFVDLGVLETNDVYRRKVNLEIPVGKLYDMMDIN